jgi:hypothetical protein
MSVIKNFAAVATPPPVSIRCPATPAWRGGSSRSMKDSSNTSPAQADASRDPGSSSNNHQSEINMKSITTPRNEVIGQEPPQATVELPQGMAADMFDFAQRLSHQAAEEARIKRSHFGPNKVLRWIAQVARRQEEMTFEAFDRHAGPFGIAGPGNQNGTRIWRFMEDSPHYRGDHEMIYDQLIVLIMQQVAKTCIPRATVDRAAFKRHVFTRMEHFDKGCGPSEMSEDFKSELRRQNTRVKHVCLLYPVAWKCLPSDLARRFNLTEEEVRLTISALIYDDDIVKNDLLARDGDEAVYLTPPSHIFYFCDWDESTNFSHVVERALGGVFTVPAEWETFYGHL